jgi:hypothetical protein
VPSRQDRGGSLARFSNASRCRAAVIRLSRSLAVWAFRIRRASKDDIASSRDAKGEFGIVGLLLSTSYELDIDRLSTVPSGELKG